MQFFIIHFYVIVFLILTKIAPRQQGTLRNNFEIGARGIVNFKPGPKGDYFRMHFPFFFVLMRHKKTKTIYKKFQNPSLESHFFHFFKSNLKTNLSSQSNTILALIWKLS